MVRVDGSNEPIKPTKTEAASGAKETKPLDQVQGADPKSAAAIVAATFLASPLTAAFVAFPKVKKGLDEKNPAVGDAIRDGLYAKVHKYPEVDTGEGPATPLATG